MVVNSNKKIPNSFKILFLPKDFCNQFFSNNYDETEEQKETSKIKLDKKSIFFFVKNKADSFCHISVAVNDPDFLSCLISQ